MTTAIDAEHVSKRYRLRGGAGRTLKELLLGQYPSALEVKALEDISFRVEAGESVGVIGANGSGKSTLLKLVAGTSRPTSGRLEVRGRVSALLEIGAGFHPDFSGRENAYLNGSILGLSRRAMDALLPSIQAFADLGRFFDAPVKTYSSGMYTRLGFAVAAHVDPEILLIDEVLAVGDAYFQHKCFAKINEFRERKKTIFFVSHDLNAVQSLCQRAIALERGRILAEGAVRYVVETYEDSIRAREDAALAREDEETIGGRRRWGTRRVEITGVRFLDGEGQESHVLRSGAPAAVEIGYRAAADVPRVAFGVLLYHDDGYGIYGTNSAIDGERIDLRAGEGSARFRVDRLELLDGQYVVDVAVHAADDSETYDYHLKSHRFRVFGGRGAEIGVVRLPHTWEMESGVPDARAEKDPSRRD